MKIETGSTPECIAKAWLEDEHGQVGPIVYANTFDEAVFKLGVAYGSRQQEFARPLDKIIPVEN